MPKSATQSSPLRVEQEVGGLDVAVDDPLVVRVCDRLGRLDAQASDRADVRPICDREWGDGLSRSLLAARCWAAGRCRNRGVGAKRPVSRPCARELRLVDLSSVACTVVTLVSTQAPSEGLGARGVSANACASPPQPPSGRSLPEGRG